MVVERGDGERLQVQQVGVGRVALGEDQVLERDGKLGELDHRTDALQVEDPLLKKYQTIYCVIQEGANMFMTNAKTLQRKKRCHLKSSQLCETA